MTSLPFTLVDSPTSRSKVRSRAADVGLSPVQAQGNRVKAAASRVERFIGLRLESTPCPGPIDGPADIGSI
jgi:hypothetical protein